MSYCHQFLLFGLVFSNEYCCVKYIMMILILMAQTPHEDISNYLNDPFSVADFLHE